MPWPRTIRSEPSRAATAGEPNPWTRWARSSRSSASFGTVAASPPGQAEHALGDDVPLHLGGAGRDRAALGVEEEMRPLAVVDGVRRVAQQLRVRADDLARDVEL